MRAIILGCGRMGRIRAESLHAMGICIAAVYDPDNARAVELAERLGARRVLASDSESWPEAELAFICTPPDSHVPLALRAVKAGLSVLIEKPLSLTANDVLPLKEAVRASGTLCAVGNMNRLRPSVEAIRARFKPTEAFALNAHWIGGAYAVPWWRDVGRSGGGFNEQGVHVVDLIAFIAGPVCSVSAMRSTDGNEADPMVVSVAFRHQGGCLSSFTYSYRSADRSIEFNVFSTMGSARLSGWSFDLEVNGERIHGNGGDPDRNWIFQREIAAFVAGVREGALPPGMADLDTALATQRLMDAIRRAYASGDTIAIDAEPPVREGYKGAAAV